ncbi:MAG: hypothetical protein QGH52_01810 [Prochlorococcaceae cyanobacterium ETNP1_MAG_8]|nr:hypothetical protein [Prochlorococcaceae cyanobacterium ETNP1_MAG_8]
MHRCLMPSSDIAALGISLLALVCNPFSSISIATIHKVEVTGNT